MNEEGGSSDPGDRTIDGDDDDDDDDEDAITERQSGALSVN